MPDIDGINLIITLDPGVTTIDVQADLYSPWKNFMRSSDAEGRPNSRFPPAFRTVGGDNLTPGIEAGAYFFLQNQLGWRLRPAEGDATVNFTGNLAPEDSALPMTVPTLGGFTVLLNGLQPITQNVDTILESTQDSLYGGKVFINTFTGDPGTEFPIGTASNPVSNLADALAILNAKGFSELVLIGSIVLTEAFTFKKITGQIGVANVDVNGQNVSGTQFERCAMQGDFSAVVAATPAAMFQCILIGTIANFVGNMGECLITQGVSLQAGHTNFNRCLSNVPGTGRPFIDFQGNAADLSARGYAGGLELRNITNAATDASVDLLSGRLTLDNSITAGTIVVGDVGTLNNNVGGTAIVNKDSLVDGLDVKLIKALDAGNVTITGSNPFVITVLDPDDNITVIGTWEVTPDGKTRTRTS